MAFDMIVPSVQLCIIDFSSVQFGKVN
jgi:hypothetical protein